MNHKTLLYGSGIMMVLAIITRIASDRILAAPLFAGGLVLLFIGLAVFENIPRK